jgi:hypothetical protein
MMYSLMISNNYHLSMPIGAILYAKNARLSCIIPPQREVISIIILKNKLALALQQINEGIIY